MAVYLSKMAATMVGPTLSYARVCMYWYSNVMYVISQTDATLLVFQNGV